MMVEENGKPVGKLDEDREKTDAIPGKIPILFQNRLREGGYDVVMSPTVHDERTDSIEPGDYVLVLTRVYTVRKSGGYVGEQRTTEKQRALEISPAMEETYILATGRSVGDVFDSSIEVKGWGWAR